MLSVRSRITLLAALLTAAVLVLASAWLVAELDRSLTSSSDEVSRTKLDELAARVADGRLHPELGDAGNGVVQVVDVSGLVLAASDNVAGRPRITRFQPTGTTPAVVVVRGAPDDQETEDYRVWARRVTTRDGDATLYVGDSLESVREATASLRRALETGVPLALVVLVGATWFLVGRALRPVEAIRAEVEGITDRQLGRRVPVPKGDDEVGRLARTMNDMLDRLDRSRRREREFLADASHELLSPLAATRAVLEVGPPVRPEGWDQFARGLLAENATMERTVRDLLFLARDEAGRRPHRVAIDLDDVVLEEAVRLRTITDLTIDTTGVSAGPVLGDREEMSVLVRNLLENAVRYAATTVRVRLHTEGSTVILHVRDDGPGVDPELGDHVFERFVRGDPARSRTYAGSGLGLAIARAVAERHRGTLSLADPDPGAHFVVTLPADHSGDHSGDPAAQRTRSTRPSSQTGWPDS